LSIEPLERKKGRVYRVRWRDHNNQPRSKTLSRKADAIAFDADIKRKKQMGELLIHEQGNVTLAAFGLEWWRLYAEPNLAERTRRSYSGLWDRHVLPYLGDVRLRDLRPSVIEGHLAQLRDAGVGAPTVHRVYVVLSSVLQRAFEWERIAENQCRRVRSSAPKREREPNVLTDAQIESLMNACWRDRDKLIVGMMAYGGFRPQELCALTWSDVTSVIRVDKATAPRVGTKSTKNRVERNVPVSTQLAGVLGLYGTFDGEYVITKANGEPFNDGTWQTWHKDVWGPICESAGLEGYIPYDLRHTYISRLIAQGADVVKVAKQAGNTPATTLKVYAHLFES
jgi:integrase